MRKFILAALTSVAMCAIGFASEFSARLVPTKAVNTEDQFRHIMPNRPPFSPLVSRVVCGEPFYIEIMFSGAKIQDGAIKLSGKLVITDPKGKKDEIPLRSTVGNLSGNTAGVYLFPQKIGITYEPEDPKGKCTFDMMLTDENSGKTVNSSASVQYVEMVYPQPGIKASDKIGKYYLSPCPEYIVPAFREYLANLPMQKKKEGKNFNPLPQLSLFCFLLQENPQCVKPFTELFKSLHDEEKYFAAIVLYFTSEDAAKALNKKQRQAIREKFPANPFQFEKATAPWQLDVCWSEFFVRGTKAPVMKIVNTLNTANDYITIDDYKKIAKPTPEDRRKLMNHLLAMAAHWSMKSLAQTHPLIRYYVEAALLRKEVKDPSAAVLAANAIGMKIKTKKQ